MPKKPPKPRRSQAQDSVTMQAELESCNSLIEQVGEALGVDVDDAITPSNVARYTAKLVSAIASNATPQRTGALSGGNFDEFDDLDQEIDRANQRPGQAGQAGRSTALQRSERRTAGPDDADAAIQGVLANIAYELDLDVGGLSLHQALDAVYTELTRIKNPSSDVATDAAGPLTKGDSLAEAVAHNSQVRDDLVKQLTASRAIVSRVAGAMQIAEYDADGTQLVERIQRWETFKHILSRRIKELLGGAKIASDDVHQDVANELQLHLATLMSSAEFAKWMRGKPKRAVTPAVAAMAAFERIPEFRKFLHGDVVRLAHVLAEVKDRDPLLEWLHADFHGIASSTTASDEFVRMMNLVVLPIVATQRPAAPAPTTT